MDQLPKCIICIVYKYVFDFNFKSVKQEMINRTSHVLFFLNRKDYRALHHGTTCGEERGVYYFILRSPPLNLLKQ